MASHRQDFSVARVKGHDGTGPGPQRLLRHLLQVVVNSQLNLLARNGVLGGKGPDFLSHAVHDDAALAVGTHQDVVVLPFEAELAGKVTHAQLAIAGFDLLLADLAHVADGVREKSVWQIAPPRNRDHLENRDVRMVRFDKGKVCRRSVGLDDDGLEFRKTLGVVELVFQIIKWNAETVGYAGKIFCDQNRIFPQQEHAEGRTVINQDAAIAVQHAAAGRDDRNFAHAIALGHRGILIRVDDLQLPEAEQQHSDHSHDDVGSHGQPPLRQSIIVAKPVRHENPAREYFNPRAQRPSGPISTTGRSKLASRKNPQRGFRVDPENEQSHIENVRRKFPRTWEPKKSPGAPESPLD